LIDFCSEIICRRRRWQRRQSGARAAAHQTCGEVQLSMPAHCESSERERDTRCLLCVISEREKEREAPLNVGRQHVAVLFRHNRPLVNSILWTSRSAEHVTCARLGLFLSLSVCGCHGLVFCCRRSLPRKYWRIEIIMHATRAHGNRKSAHRKQTLPKRRSRVGLCAWGIALKKCLPHRFLRPTMLAVDAFLYPRSVSGSCNF
jgi:hypothetical protein